MSFHHILDFIPGKPHRLQKPQTIKAAIPAIAFYRHELPAAPAWKRSSGWVDGGLCPFHDDGRAGSFRVHLETGAYCCFACGAKGGDIVDFVQQWEGLTFPNALEKLSREWGV